MRKKIILGLLLVLAISLTTWITAFAQEGDLPSCSGEQVSGTVVAVDEASGTVTIDTGDGILCTVRITEDAYQHPIVALLGTYFDDLDIGDYSSNLESLQRCVLQNQDLEWVLVDCETEGAQLGRIVGKNEDGSFAFLIDGEEEPVAISFDDSDQVDQIDELLESLIVDWDLSEGGDVIQAGDEIAAYHDEGMGFGVLVKLYAMAQESQEACQLLELDEGEVCGVTVEELVAALQYDGVGMGQLYKTFGKPAMRGVGHVRQELREGQGKPPWAGPKDKWNEETEEVGDMDAAEDTVTDEGSQPPGRGNQNGNKDKDNGNGNGNGNENRPSKGAPPGKGGPPRGKGKK